MSENKLIIAAAGSGKTTHLVNEALSMPDKKILITTYTLSNEASIKHNIIKQKGYVPGNITIQTWFSFLIQHGIKPFQGSLADILYDFKIKGLHFAHTRSAMYVPESNPVRHYFDSSRKIYSDKLSKCVARCNDKSDGAVFGRITRIFDSILIDEVQDLAGYDLEIIKRLFETPSLVLLVGDPRQVTYLTHIEQKYKKYNYGKIRDFIENELGEKTTCTIDETSLNQSHRNNQQICEYSSKLYPELETTLSCSCCVDCATDHEGIFLVKPDDLDSYCNKKEVIQLRWSASTKVKPDSPVMNFGESKGLSFDRVLIYPTQPIKKWINDNSQPLTEEARAKFYVALTRARNSVAIVMDFDENQEYEGVKKYSLG